MDSTGRVHFSKEKWRLLEETRWRSARDTLTPKYSPVLVQCRAETCVARVETLSGISKEPGGPHFR